MEYVIGIDSGGTNFRIKACTLDGNELGYYVGSEANHYHNIEEEMLLRIDSHFTKLLSQFNGKREDCRYIVCGTTGLDSPEDGEFLERCYAKLEGFSCPVKVINDAELAHYTVVEGEGVLIISGTGSIAFAKDKNGRTARSGGYLFTILGDEGSGSWVSRAALQLLGRYYDGSVERTKLITYIEEKLNLHDRNGLNRLAADMGLKPWHTPDLGPLVDKASEEGDFESISILKRAAHYIFGIIEDAVNAISLDKTEPDFKLGLWGSNLLNSSVMKSELVYLVRNKYPECRIVETNRKSIDGALKMALDLVKNT